MNFPRSFGALLGFQVGSDATVLCTAGGAKAGAGIGSTADLLGKNTKENMFGVGLNLEKLFVYVFFRKNSLF